MLLDTDTKGTTTDMKYSKRNRELAGNIIFTKRKEKHIYMRQNQIHIKKH